MRIYNKLYKASKAVISCSSVLGMLFFSAEGCFKNSVTRKSNVGGNSAKQPSLNGTVALSPIPVLKRGGPFLLSSNGGSASSSVQLAEKKRSQEESVQQEEIVQIIQGCMAPLIKDVAHAEKKVLEQLSLLATLRSYDSNNVHREGLNTLEENFRKSKNAIQRMGAYVKNVHLGAYPKTIAEMLVKQKLNLSAKRGEALKVVEQQVADEAKVGWGNWKRLEFYLIKFFEKLEEISRAIQLDLDKDEEERQAYAAARAEAARAEAARAEAAAREAAAREAAARELIIEAYENVASIHRNGTIRSVGGEDECSICLCVLSPQQEGLDSLVHLPRKGKSCRHIFHLRCIANSIRSGHNTCPTCRTYISVDDRKEIGDAFQLFTPSSGPA